MKVVIDNRGFITKEELLNSLFLNNSEKPEEKFASSLISDCYFYSHEEASSWFENTAEEVIWNIIDNRTGTIIEMEEDLQRAEKTIQIYEESDSDYGDFHINNYSIKMEVMK